MAVLAVRTWIPKIGDLVCDCSGEHKRVTDISYESDEVVFEDGKRCSISFCIAPVDHPDEIHLRPKE